MATQVRRTWPKIKSSSLPELPGDSASKHELADTSIAELEGDSVHTFQFCPPLRPKRPIPFTDLTPTEATSDISSKISEDLPNTEAPSDLNEDCSIHDLNDDLFDLYYY